MNTATVVADHASERAARVRGRIGRIGQVVLFGCVAQTIQHNARLNYGNLLRRIDIGEPVHVAGIIKHHGNIRALPRQAGARPARKYRRALRPARCQRGFHVPGVPRKNDAHRKLPVIRGVGCVESARAKVEAHLAAHVLLEDRFKLAVRRKAFVVEGRLIGKDRKGRIAHREMVARLCRREAVPGDTPLRFSFRFGVGRADGPLYAKGEPPALPGCRQGVRTVREPVPVSVLGFFLQNREKEEHERRAYGTPEALLLALTQR